MSLQFSNALTRIDGFWTTFKATVAARGLSPFVQYDDDGVSYSIFAIEEPLCFTCMIYLGAVPGGIYTQAQNDADKADFEANFKPYANRSIDDVPSLIVANAIKTGGGSSANLGVNGSIIPVVFEYNPPNNRDIEINALSLLFESTGALGFGNVFVRTSIATLTNGLLLEVKANDDVVSPWQNMKRTRDIVEICSDFTIITGTTNFMRAKIHLPRTLRLARNGTFATPDYVRLTVRDDLSTIGFGEAHFQGVKL